MIRAIRLHQLPPAKRLSTRLFSYLTFDPELERSKLLKQQREDLVKQNSRLAEKLKPLTSDELLQKQKSLKEDLSALQETNTVLNRIVTRKVLEPNNEQLQKKQQKLLRERDQIIEENQLLENCLNKNDESKNLTTENCKKIRTSISDKKLHKPKFVKEKTLNVENVQHHFHSFPTSPIVQEPSVLFYQTPVLPNLRSNQSAHVGPKTKVSSGGGGSGGGKKTTKDGDVQNDDDGKSKYKWFFGGFIFGNLSMYAYRSFSDYKREQKRLILVAENEEIERQIEHEKSKQERLLREIARQKNN